MKHRVRSSLVQAIPRPGSVLRFLLAAAFLHALPNAASQPARNKLVGQPAPEWSVEHWLNSGPLTLQQLRGKVVLVRWWTAPDCPFCAATAPALNEFHEKWGDQGLAVLGFYHHKAGTPLRVEDVKGYANKFGFKFPVAIDPDWRTLKKWWLDAEPRGWTSVSFLLDRQGRIRHIHPGGQYVQGEDAYLEMRRRIEELLAEPKADGK